MRTAGRAAVPILLLALVGACAREAEPRRELRAAARASRASTSVGVSVVASGFRASGDATMRPPRTRLGFDGVELLIERGEATVVADGSIATLGRQRAPVPAIDDVPALLAALARGQFVDRVGARSFRVVVAGTALAVKLNREGLVASVALRSGGLHATVRLGPYRR